MVINKEVKIFPSGLALALGTQPEKIETVKGNSISGLLSHFITEFIDAGDFRVHDLPAFGADGVGVGIWPVAVIAIAAVRESQFKYLIQFLEQRNGLVNRGDAGCWKSIPDFIIYFINAGVILTGGQDIDDGQSLRREAKIPTLYLGQYLRQAFFCLLYSFMAFQSTTSNKEYKYL
jgi:hypothetical protein